LEVPSEENLGQDKTPLPQETLTDKYNAQVNIGAGEERTTKFSQK
jgi:hypothetical protein